MLWGFSGGTEKLRLSILASEQNNGKKCNAGQTGAESSRKRKTGVICSSSRCSSRWAGVCVEAGRAVGRCWERGDLEEEELRREEGQALDQHDLKPGIPAAASRVRGPQLPFLGHVGSASPYGWVQPGSPLSGPFGVTFCKGAELGLQTGERLRWPGCREGILCTDIHGPGAFCSLKD